MKDLKGQDLKEKTIEQWFLKRHQADMAELKADYVARYKALKDYLTTDVHPHVATGAAIRNGIFLNDHGPAHIATVIKRASSMLSGQARTLSAYEVYILLCAIQLHDAGNILGRTGHEQRLQAFEGRLEHLLGDDTAEKRVIKSIAQAHGGERNGNSDTISYILEQPVLNQNVRARVLAALLRFADELADDSQRISYFPLQNNAVPPASLLYHRYSASLQSCMIDTRGRAIDLHYEMTAADAKYRFALGESTRLLVDEILARTLKMHRERSYCMRFLRPMVEIDSINVKLNVYERSNSSDELYRWGYRLEERGYPNSPSGGIYELCPELTTSLEGGPLNGENLINAIEGARNEHASQSV